VTGEPFAVVAFQDTTAIRAVEPAMTVVIVGVDGTAFGITEPNAFEVALSPITLVAIPVIVYLTPAESPLIVHESCVVVLHDETAVAPPSTLYALYVYEVTGRPVFGVEAAQEIVAEVAVTESSVGWPGGEGTTPGVTVTGFDARPAPKEFKPRTRTV